MKTIEFIGPSGIGKSTFLNEFAKYSQKNEIWMPFTTELKQIKASQKNFLPRVIQKITPIKMGIKPKRAIKNYLFKKYEEEIDVFAELFFRNINNVSHLSSSEMIILTDYYFNTIILNLLIVLHNSSSRHTLVLDEGIIINGLLAGTDINRRIKSKLSESAIFPSGVVYLNLDDASYKKRISKRFKVWGENRLNPVLKAVDEDRIDEYVSHLKAWSKKKLELCRRLDLPVLEATANSTQSQFEKLDDFIEMIHNFNHSNPESFRDADRTQGGSPTLT